MREVEESPLLAPRLNKSPGSASSWVERAMVSTAASSCEAVPMTLEEVAMAAAADTTARIRAAAERALAPRGAVPAPPWALVPMAPMYSWQPYVPMMPSMGPLGMGSMGSMGLKSDEKKHREELQHELADLRSRFQELQDSYNQLEKENHQLKTVPGTAGKLDETCRRQEQDIIHLKRALKEREEGEASLRRLFVEEQALSRNVLRENERLKHELSISKVGEDKSRLDSRRRSSSSTGTTGSVIEVDLTGEL